MSDIRLTFNNKAATIKRLGIARGGIGQVFVDNEVIREMQKRMPFDTGAMSASVPMHSNVGEGIVRVVTPYARWQSEHNPGPGNKPGEPLRGKHFFERTKAECRDDILRGAARLLGAKGKTD